MTLFLSNDIDFKTKKNDKKLENKLEVTKSSDIELNGGFIFIKNSCVIESNKKLNLRKSIISK